MKSAFMTRDAGLLMRTVTGSWARTVVASASADTAAE